MALGQGRVRVEGIGGQAEDRFSGHHHQLATLKVTLDDRTVFARVRNRPHGALQCRHGRHAPFPLGQCQRRLVDEHGEAILGRPSGLMGGLQEGLRRRAVDQIISQARPHPLYGQSLPGQPRAGGVHH